MISDPWYWQRHAAPWNYCPCCGKPMNQWLSQPGVYGPVADSYTQQLEEKNKKTNEGNA